MTEQQQQSETTAILARLQYRLESEYEAKFIPGRSTYFFELPFPSDATRQLEAFALDSAYCAVAAPEHVVAFRAYVQLREYIARLGSGWVKQVCESADYVARRRIEDLLKNT